MKTTAAILEHTSKPLIVDEITIPKLQQGQVLVKIEYSGVCHTQLLEVRGKRGEDAFLPHCLGHEGSGTVLEISEGVTKVQPGDRVILSWIKGNGANIASAKYTWNNQTVNSGAIATFNKHAVISENRLTKIPADFSIQQAALLGCALPTGVGSVINTANAQPNESLAVFGCGGIGLFAIQAAAIAKCSPIIAIDIYDDKLELAKQMGATHTINATKQDPLAEIAKIGSLDIAIEASGSPKAMSQALESVKALGGRAVIVGNAHHGKTISLDPKHFNMGKKLLGTWGGENTPDVHFPKYCSWVEKGDLNTSSFTQKTYSLKDINEALDDLEQGKILRPIIDMSL